MNEDIFDDLLIDEGATGMIDPLTGESYNPLDDFNEFKDTTIVRDASSEEGKSGYLEIPKNIMDDNDIPDASLNNSTTDGLVLDLLKSKGINPDSIKILDEDEQIQEIAFKDLSNDEKLELLKYNQNDEEFDDHELEAIEFLRQNNLTLNELAQVIKQKTIEELNNATKNFEVDGFSDDELFLVDFKNKYGDDFTDEELLTALDKAKENEDLYGKQVNKIREEYKNYEIQLKEDEVKQAELAKQQEEEQYISQIVNVAKSLNDLHDTIDLDDNDKEDILSFMFDKTATGESLFDKAIKNPETRYKAAWYVKNGDSAFREVSNYYKGEISKLQRELSKYTKRDDKPEAFIKNTKNNTTQRPIRRLEDLL